MTIEYTVIPYPDFKLHEIIEPDEFDFNNDALMKKIDETIVILNRIMDGVEPGVSGADLISMSPIAPFASNKLQAFLAEVVNHLNGATGSAFIGSAPITGVAGTTAYQQLVSLKSLLDAEKVRVNSALDVERARITSAQSDIASEKLKTAKLQSDMTAEKAKIATLQSDSVVEKGKVATLQGQMANHNHDTRYMTRTELAPYLQGGDTIVKVEVFTIVTSNNGDGTFTYTNRAGATKTGQVGPSGEQIFTLELGTYKSNLNHIKAIIGDTLYRSLASGGLIETAHNKFALTNPEGVGTEVTVEYFERLGVTGEHSVTYGKTTPAPTSGSVMWFKELI